MPDTVNYRISARAITYFLDWWVSAYSVRSACSVRGDNPLRGTYSVVYGVLFLSPVALCSLFENNSLNLIMFNYLCFLD